MSELSTPELLDFRAELEAASARARSLCDGLGEAALGWRPASKSWSIAECLRHLDITTEVFLPGVDEALERARSRGTLGGGPYRLGRWGRLLVWYVEPPPPIRLPAPAPLRPTLDGPASDALPRFLASQETLAAKLPELEGIDLQRTTYVSPIARYIRMSLLAFLRVHTAHERRHLWQAGNVRAVLPRELARAPDPLTGD